MKESEFVMIAAAIKNYYPNDKMFASKEIITLWFERLQDINKDILTAAVNRWVETQKFPPTIADLRSEAANIILGGNLPSWDDAWEKVVRAISRYGSYNYEEAIESFDEVTQKAVKRLGWNNICMNDLGITRANFRDIYNTLSERKKADVQISPAIKDLITSCAEKMKLLE